MLSDQPAAIGPRHNTTPCCLTCLRCPKKSGNVKNGEDTNFLLRPVTGEYCCPSCNFPMCGEECAKDPRHADQECSIFPRFPEGLWICLRVSVRWYVCVCVKKDLILNRIILLALWFVSVSIKALASEEGPDYGQ